MYLPKHFETADTDLINDLITENSFAPLLSFHPDGKLESINHYPFFLTRNEKGDQCLMAHMARANPQWKAIEENFEVVVIIQGPHHYISPNWYPADPANVPTWNYSVAHVRGQVKVIDDPVSAYEWMKYFVETEESRLPNPWKLDLSDSDKKGLMRGIVVFEISIDEIVSKFKMSQNRTAETRQMVKKNLQKLDGQAALAVRHLMDKIES